MKLLLSYLAPCLVLMVCVACPKPISVNDVYNGEADSLTDESVHFKNSLEWWYFTGHLQDTLTKKEYGIEYVFFHFNPRNKSDYLMGNFAISDPHDSVFTYDYKIFKCDTLLSEQMPLNLSIPYQWSIWQLKGSHGNYRLRAAMPKNPGYAMDVTTSSRTPVWMHGDGSGYQSYGPYAKAGYYSYPKLTTKGTLTINQNTIPVRGTLWYDRQWNCIGVYQRQVAWDWMAIQLDDGSDLMLFKLYHRKDQKVIYGGSYRKGNGEVQTLAQEDIVIEELSFWDSPRSKIRYPVSWLVSLPRHSIKLNVEARFPHQELSLKFAALYNLHYWEGMSAVKGTTGDKSIQGKAYVEITNRKWVQK